KRLNEAGTACARNHSAEDRQNLLSRFGFKFHRSESFEKTGFGNGLCKLSINKLSRRLLIKGLVWALISTTPNPINNNIVIMIIFLAATACFTGNLWICIATKVNK